LYGGNYPVGFAVDNEGEDLGFEVLSEEGVLRRGGPLRTRGGMSDDLLLDRVVAVLGTR